MGSLFALCLVVTPSFCPAAEEVPLTDAALLEFVGSPAQRERAVRAVQTARLWASADRARLASVLGRAGGLGAVAALEAMVSDPSRDVRFACLRALHGTGIRLESATEEVRRRFAWDPPSGETVLLLRVLGRIGDGRDVERLISALESEDGPSRIAALAGLQGLTGSRRMQSAARWRAWHRKVVPRKRREIRALLDSTSQSTLGGVSGEQLTELRRWSWVDMPAVTKHLRGWLTSGREPLRIEACRLAADMRLGDLAADLRLMAERPHADSASLEAARAALDRLGVRYGATQGPTEQRPRPAR